MVYNVIGLMSGSSLDGLDIAYVEISEIGGKFTFDLKKAECIPYSDDWKSILKEAASMPLPDYFRAHTAYGRYLGESVREFIHRHELFHKVHLIASHGHTVFHEPSSKTSVQMGDGASINAITQISVVSDLRNKDVALGGQGAPIVPIAEKYFWSSYDFCLNIGGIANVTVNGEEPLAFDICSANQVLNHFAQISGMEFDEDGALAATGTIDHSILETLNSHSYFSIAGPKSLSNDFTTYYVSHLAALSPQDALATMIEHISIQVAQHIKPFIAHPSQQMIITGGGAHNTFLVSRINHYLESQVSIHKLDKELIDYKEAIAMALIGVLRWREENNVLSSVTGAQQDSVGGALWVN